jgi:uncharacterized protein (DUF2249 family)
MLRPSQDRPVSVIDVSTLPAGTCRPTIESTFERLRPGEALEIVVAHDPAPLRERFASERPGASVWTYLARGPVTWRVRVERVA